MKATDLINPNWFDNIEHRECPWPGLTWMTTMLAVPKVEEAIAFYQSVFGVSPIYVNKSENGRIVFARMRYRGINFCLNETGRFDTRGVHPSASNTPPPFFIYMYVDDVDHFYLNAIENGCISIQEPYMEVWGDKKARIEDRYGYVWDIATRV